MGMKVDKARRHQFAAGVDLLFAFGRNPADFDDTAVFHGHIGFEQFAAEPVGDAAAADREVWQEILIVGHGVPSRGSSCRC